MKDTKPLVAIIANVLRKRTWLYEAGIPQQIHTRLSTSCEVIWCLHEPSTLYPNIEHTSYVPLGLKAEIADALRTPLKKFQQKDKASWKSVFKEQSGGIRPYEKTIPRLYSIARQMNAPFIALVKDDQTAICSDAIEYFLRIAEKHKADLIYSSQFDGLLPVIISSTMLEKWLHGTPNPNPELLWRASELKGFGKVEDLQLLDATKFEGSIRCSPIDHHEIRLKAYWEERQEILSNIFKDSPDKRGTGRLELQKLMLEYRSIMTPGLEEYHVVGTLYDVNDLRQEMMTTQKPLADYFVVATHYGRFLQKYAGLRSNSHVVDIGCSWGYLGFALANLLDKDGSYLGIEVQPEAVKWASERLNWLGDNFRFSLLDIQNDYYNPDGDIPRGQVNLPIKNRWASTIIAGSVFTHMQEDGVQSYLREFYRILVPGGIAAFSYDDNTFWGTNEDYLIYYKSIPDKATIYSRKKISEMIKKANLKMFHQPVNMRQFDRTEYQTWYFAVK